ncbi:MAG: nuclear transport factor 2 family protein [Pseudomonadales bacterium]|nr:nuclear transport factor 2 family protein [Pseudomonadales bacterium]NIX07402.1 nuclear transport factor 2 family protein [Pseudomonadales bacterium]
MDTAVRLAIHDLLGRSAYALDERHVEMLEGTFTEDASFELDIEGVEGTMSFEGREAIMGLITDSMAEQTDQRRHVVTNVFFEDVAEERAKLVSNITITSVEHGQIRLVTSGLYRDEVLLKGGEWRIHRRRIELDMPY